jgi:hypothetical protein
MDDDPLFGHEEHSASHDDASQCRRALRDILTVIQSPDTGSSEEVLRKVQGLAEKGLMRETFGEPLTPPD